MQEELGFKTLNVGSLSDRLKCFHNFRASTANARLPRDLHLVLETSNTRWSDEQRDFKGGCVESKLER